MSRQLFLDFGVKLEVHQWISMEIRWEEVKVLGWKGYEHFDDGIEGCAWKNFWTGIRTCQGRTCKGCSR